MSSVQDQVNQLVSQHIDKNRESHELMLKGINELSDAVDMLSKVVLHLQRRIAKLEGVKPGSEELATIDQELAAIEERIRGKVKQAQDS